MSQSDAIAMADGPATVSSLVADLRVLGVTEAMTVMVHSSLSRLGYVSGGAHAVVTGRSDFHNLLNGMEWALRDKFNIHHTTIQLETESREADEFDAF